MNLAAAQQARTKLTEILAHYRDQAKAYADMAKDGYVREVKGAKLELFSAAAGCAAKPIAPINTAAQSMHALISSTLQNIFEPSPFDSPKNNSSLAPFTHLCIQEKGGLR
jgi:hypothetical protein